MTAATTSRHAQVPTGSRSGPRPAQRPGPLRQVLDANLTYQLLTFVVFAAAWEIYAREWGGLLIPTFTETVVATVELLGSPELWQAMYVSNQALVLGFAIAVVVGVPAGIVLGRFRRLERFADVYLNILLVTPMAAIIPLLVMSVGFGLASRVILVTIFSIVMVVVNCRAGVRQVDPSLIEMARWASVARSPAW
jgi:ABC-type nitrate/sulfonate/bicarbonate transport system permease component